MKNIKSMLPEEIEADFLEMGEPKYRAKQVFKWLARGVGSFEEMSDIPKGLREKLEKEYTIYKPKVLSKQVSKLDGTIKYLWELCDGNAVETVVMSYKHGLHLLPGGLPAGLRVLRLDHRRTCTRP